VGVFQGLRILVVLQRQNDFCPISSEITIDTGPLSVSLFRDAKAGVDFEPSELRDEMLPPSIEDILECGASRVSIHDSRLTWRHFIHRSSKNFPKDVLAAAVQLANSAIKVNQKIAEAKRLTANMSIAPFRGSLDETRATQRPQRPASLIAFEKPHLERWQKQDDRDLGSLYMRSILYGALAGLLFGPICAGTEFFHFGMIAGFLIMGGVCGGGLGLLALAVRIYQNSRFRRLSNDFVLRHSPSEAPPIATLLPSAVELQ
jgi:hypothetical protein